MKFQLSKKDSKNLFLFLSVVIVICTFAFIYIPNLNKTEKIQDEMKVKEKELERLIALEKDSTSIEKETEELHVKAKEILNRFPEFVTTEKAIVILVEMEEKTEALIDSVVFEMNQLFYPSSSASEITEGTLMGFRSRVTYTYKSTYEELKRMIAFANEYPDRISIESLTASFDTSTGNLNGSITLYLYAVPNFGHKYETPDLKKFPLGVDNIFRTFEIKGKAGKKNSR